MLYATERHEAIADKIAQLGRLSVVELAEEYSVSTETVRRDLAALERSGLLRRVHGGAVASTSRPLTEHALVERQEVRAQEKAAIGLAAAGLLPEAGSIILDAGSTTDRLASHLPVDRRLTVFTHAVQIAAKIGYQPNIEVRLLPGLVRHTTQAAVGADTIEALAKLRVDIAFVGTNGISAGHGLSTPDPTEASTKNAILRSARQVVLLADSGKIGEEHTVSFGTLADVDVLVCDAGLAKADRAWIEKAGVEVVIG